MARSIDFRVDVLRGGVPYEKLVYTQPPTVYTDSQATIKMTLRGTFLRNAKVDYLRDELKPVMIDDGVEYPLGVYRIVTCGERYTDAGVKYDTIEAYDRSILLTWSKLEQRDYWAAGTSYDTIIAHYLTAAGINRASIVASNHVLTNDREEWDIGTDYLTIINTLLEEINYEKLWFDASGTAQVVPYIAPSAGRIQHTYGGSGIKYIKPEYSSEIDMYDKPNVFIAILDNPEYETPLVATAVNDTPASRLSTVSRGVRIPEIYNVKNIASAGELQAYVNKIRNESMQTSEFVTIDTALSPTHGVGDIVAVVHGDIQGIFREIDWSMVCEAGQYMKHKLQKVVVL